jgi:predicted GTPase
MIVLDEQLLGRKLEEQIARWYQGAVCFIVDLRPNTVIKDDAIPKLLQQENEPTFITINESDFWRKTTINSSFCIVCFAMPDSRAREIPQRLRKLLDHPLFDAKKKRMGKMIRVAEKEVSYYSAEDMMIRVVESLSVKE